MAKFVGKYRYENDYNDSDDYESTKVNVRSKKHKNMSAEQRKMRNRQYREDDYGYDNYTGRSRHAKM